MPALAMPEPPHSITFVDATAQGPKEVERRVRRGVHKGQTLLLLRTDTVALQQGLPHKQQQRDKEQGKRVKTKGGEQNRE